MLKVEVKAPMARVRQYLRQVQQEVLADERFRSVLVYYDVDPM